MAIPILRTPPLRLFGAGRLPLLDPVRRWHCPLCHAQDVTREAKPHTRYHTCPKMRYLTTPMMPAGVDGTHELHEWDDYVGKEWVQRDPERNRPISSIITIRDDARDGRGPGQDCTVFAPTAHAGRD